WPTRSALPSHRHNRPATRPVRASAARSPAPYRGRRPHTTRQHPSLLQPSAARRFRLALIVCLAVPSTGSGDIRRRRPGPSSAPRGRLRESFLDRVRETALPASAREAPRMGEAALAHLRRERPTHLCDGGLQTLHVVRCGCVTLFDVRLPVCAALLPGGGVVR